MKPKQTSRPVSLPLSLSLACTPTQDRGLFPNRGDLVHRLEDIVLISQEPDTADHFHVLVKVEDERNTVRQVELHDVGI